MRTIRELQEFIGVVPDGIWGPKSQAALDGILSNRGHTVKASSFADPADVRRFNVCKANGGTDMQCFQVGDNGIGKWGHNTAQESEPMAALPREVWQRAKKTGGDKLVVSYGGKTVEGILGDTLPFLKNIRNGVGIDLNPAFAKALGITPPFLIHGVTWRWI